MYANRKIWLSFCIIAMVFAISCEQKLEDTGDFLKTVTWIELKKQNSFITRKISGIVQPIDTTDVSFEISGKVTRIYFDLGKKFRRGDLLAELDNKILNLTFEQRKAEYLEAKANLIEFEDDYKRKQALVEKGSVSK